MRLLRSTPSTLKSYTAPSSLVERGGTGSRDAPVKRPALKLTPSSTYRNRSTSYPKASLRDCRTQAVQPCFRFQPALDRAHDRHQAVDPGLGGVFSHLHIVVAEMHPGAPLAELNDSQGATQTIVVICVYHGFGYRAVVRTLVSRRVDPPSTPKNRQDFMGIWKRCDVCGAINAVSRRLTSG